MTRHILSFVKHAHTSDIGNMFVQGMLVGAMSIVYFACQANLAVPSGAMISCSGHDECPSGYLCEDTIGRCIEVTKRDADLIPPRATDILVTPSIAKAGREISVRFRVSEPLTGTPQLAWGSTLGAIHPPFVMGTQDGFYYTFTTVMTGAENEGLQQILVTLADRVGNSSERLRLAEVTLDFTPPNIITDTPPVIPRYLQAGSTLDFDFSVTELLLTLPELMLVHAITGTKFALQVTGQVIGQAGDLNYHASLTIDSSVVEGDYLVLLEAMQDTAGNTSAAITLGHITIDDSPPGVIQPPFFEPSVVSGQAGYDVSTLKFTLAEEAAQLDVKVGARLLACNHVSTGEGVALRVFYSCDYGVDSFDLSGSLLADINVTDAAENSIDLADATLRIDLDTPAVDAVSVSYSAALGAATLLPLTAASTGGVITVTVTPDELLDSSVAPVLQLTKGAEVFAMILQSSVDGTYTFTVTVETSLFGNGALTPLLTWQDKVGNITSSATFLSPKIMTYSNKPVLAVAQNQVVYLRSPVGNSAALGAGDEEVSSGLRYQLAPVNTVGNGPIPQSAFRFIDREIALLEIWGNSSLTNRLGDLTPGSEGAWQRFSISDGSLLALFVTALDGTGQRSAVVKIEHNVQVIVPQSLGITSTPSEPTASMLLASHEVTATQLPSVVSTLLINNTLDGTDGTLFTIESEPRWNGLPMGASKPSARSHQVAAYDVQHNKLVLFGGELSATATQDNALWEWDGATWSQLSVTGWFNPPGRRNATMVYDNNGAVLMLGGEYNGGKSGQLWQWNGSAWNQRKYFSNQQRSHHAAVFRKGNMVIFGGIDSSGNLRNDTWQWNRVNNTWSDVTGQTTRPSIRRSHAMAYDSVRDKVVLFGGFDGAQKRNDLWEWNGTAWTQITINGAWPSARMEHTLAWDALRNRVTLFGGITASGVTNDLWEWDGVQWLQLKTSGTSAQARSGHQAVFYTDSSSATNRMAVLGGQGVSGNYLTGYSSLVNTVGRTPAVHFGVQLLATDFITARSVIQSIRVRAFCGGTFAPFASTDTGAALWGWAAGAWHVLSANDQQPLMGSPAAESLINWQSSSAIDAQGYVDTGMTGMVAMQCRPIGASNTSQEAILSVDYMEMRVRYVAP